MSESGSLDLPVEDDQLLAQEGVLDDQATSAACEIKWQVRQRATVIWLDPSSKSAQDGREQGGECLKRKRNHGLPIRLQDRDRDCTRLRNKVPGFRADGHFRPGHCVFRALALAGLRAEEGETHNIRHT